MRDSVGSVPETLATSFPNLAGFTLALRKRCFQFLEAAGHLERLLDLVVRSVLEQTVKEVCGSGARLIFGDAGRRLR